MAFPKKDTEVSSIKAANIVRTMIRIVGTSPYCQHKFSAKAKRQMMDAMSTPAAAKKTKAARDPRNYDQEFHDAQHKSAEGWVGIPCAAFRTAMIDACRTVALPMTKAKMSVFILPDGFDAEDGTALVRINSEEGPEKIESLVRNDNGGADVRIRPLWRKWWADLTIEYDQDMITTDSVGNLLDRAGKQVGIGEGRPFSKNSVGVGWGTFALAGGVQEVPK